MKTHEGGMARGAAGFVVASVAWAAGGMAPMCAQEGIMRPATVAPPQPPFIALESLDLAKLVPPPPAAGSAAAQAELATVLQAQAKRTEADIAWAKLVEKDNVFYHASVLGAWFTRENLPRTAALFARLESTVRALDAASKKLFPRPRPSAVSAEVQPCVTVPKSDSYPSGGAAQAQAWARLLAEIFPAKRAALLERAERVGWSRVVGGVHFPSDVAAGRVLGDALAVELLKNAEFRAAFEECRREMAAVAAK